MKKIVIFFDTPGPVGKKLRTLLFFAVTASNKSDYNIYYVNNFHLEDQKILEKSKVKYIDIKNFNTKGFEQALFITALNHLPILLSKTSNILDATICLFSYDINCKSFLLTNLQAEQDENTVFKLIVDNDAYLCSGYECILPNDKKASQRIIKPFRVFNCENKCNGRIVSSDINIAFVGDITYKNSSAIKKIISDLNDLNINKNVTLHILGKYEYDMGDISVKMSTAFSRIAFVGELDMESQREYLVNNVDIVFSNEEAVLCGMTGLPIAIPVISGSAFDNNYVWLFNNTSKNEIINNNNERLFVMLGDILTDIYYKNKKSEYGEKCFEYYKNNSMDYNQLLLKFEGSTLTVKKCIENRIINNIIRAFLLNQYKNKDLSFLDYIVPPIVDNRNVIEKYNSIQNLYDKKIKIIKKSLIKTRKIKVAFLVVFKSVFPLQPVFEEMLNESKFDPYIVVVPNVSNTMSYQITTYEDTYNYMVDKYGDRVIGGFDKRTDSYLELGDNYKIIGFANPYNSLVHYNHGSDYFLDKNVLTIYSSYGFGALAFWDEVIKLDFYNYLWKAFIDTEDNLTHLKEKEVIKGKNGLVTGYIKMDALANVKPSNRTRKRILICPHHTVFGDSTLNISNFLRYSEFFVELPKKYNEIDFVFRPHPLLFTNIIKHNIWTKSEVDDYINRLLASKNIVYDTQGDYFQSFVDSDAMIHDCGSFIGEYLYTKKPCCYMIRDKEETYNTLLPFGKKCMDQYYLAKEENDIISFIDDVVLNNKDKKKESREKFVENELMVNYPNASKFVISELKKTLGIKK